MSAALSRFRNHEGEVMSSDSRPWSVPVPVDDIPVTGAHYELAADQPTREAIARAAGLRDLLQLEAVFDLARRGAGIAATGEVRARVGQTCIVTLEPIENEVREAIDLLFIPPSELSGIGKRRKELPEPLEDGVIDLGLIAIEFLMLGIDPYPRKAGAEFVSRPAEKEGESPFAALAWVKKLP